MCFQNLKREAHLKSLNALLDYLLSWWLAKMAINHKFPPINAISFGCSYKVIQFLEKLAYLSKI